MIPAFAYTRATTVDEALGALTTPGARTLAGGTDLLGCLHDEVMNAAHLVSLSRIEALRGITETAEGGLRVGAMTTIATVAEHADVAARYPALARAAADVASPQLRNQGTLGGNLCQRPRCWFLRGGYDCARKGGAACYALQGDNRYHAIFGGSGCVIVHPSDTAVALVALEAEVGVTGPKGTRTLPIGEFFVGPDVDIRRETALEGGEIVTHVTLPPPAAGTRSVFRKVRARGAWDFALASVAIVARVDRGRVVSARVVLGAAAPVPWRATGVERAIVNQRLDARTIARAADASVAGAEPLEHNVYKVAMFRGLVAEVLTSMAT